MSNIPVGAISLSNLIGWVQNNSKHGDALHCNCPTGQALTRKMQELCINSVPKTPGVYAWIKIKDDSCEFIYIGKTGANPKLITSQLQWRLFEELRDERAFLWKAEPISLHTERIEEIWSTHYQTRAAVPHLNRALRKGGTTHILWTPTHNELSHDEIVNIERLLIQSCEPTANRQRPKPKSNCLYPYSNEIKVAWIEKSKHLTNV